MSEFSARVAHHDAAAVVELTGEVAYENRQAVTEAIVGALAEPATELVIDLRDVTFIDSVGVEAAIVSPSRAATTSNTVSRGALMVRVSGPSGNVRRPEPTSSVISPLTMSR